MNADQLRVQILEQGNVVKSLKSSKAAKGDIDAQVATLLSLKDQLAQLTGVSVDKSSKRTLVLKTPKGTRDYNDKEMALRQSIFSTVTDIFRRHGGVTIDTPVFELKDILSGKYGEDGKLIYDLQDQGGETCSLRYDLTVPFARFLAMNGTTYASMKRYHIAKVYRRDQPAMTKGRMREFYQCDFDIAGVWEPMVPDAEVIKIMQDVLTKLEVGPFIIKLNHRSILDGVFEVCGVPADQFKAISSAVDKLDKLSWEQVYHEMTQEKHLDPVVAARIGDYVKLNGGSELIGQLEADASLGANAHVQQGCRDLRLLFDYLSAFNVTSGVQFDLSLARGLDYYTGVIYEAVLTQPPTIANDPDAHIPIGSIAAGGRYDNLVGMFSASSGNKKPIKIPCVGLSIGVERVFSILLHKSNVNDIKANACQVYVISVRDGLLKERMAICQQLWEHGISAEFMYKAKPKMQAQFDVCDRDHIPYAVIIGKDEIDNDVVKVKTMKSKIAEEQGGVVMPRSEMVAYLQSKLN